MNKVYKKILNNNKGGATIMITVMIMMTILTVSFSLSSVVVNGLRVSVNQANATRAYYAAESAAEQYLWRVRQDTLDPSNNGCPIFGEYINTLLDGDGCSSLGITTISFQTNGANFYSSYEFSTPTTTIVNFGEYKDTRRAVKLTY